MAISFIEPQYGIIIPGTGPAGTLTVFTIPEERTLFMWFFFVARSDGQTSFSCYYNCCFENDDGFTPQQVGTPVKSIFRGVNAGDWDVTVEAISANELRIRGIGTAASQVRWDICNAEVYFHAAPEVEI